MCTLYIYIKSEKKSRTGMLKCVHPSTCTSLQLSPLYTAQITMHIDPLPPCPLANNLKGKESQEEQGQPQPAERCEGVNRPLFIPQGEKT